MRVSTGVRVGTFFVGGSLAVAAGTAGLLVLAAIFAALGVAVLVTRERGGGMQQNENEDMGRQLRDMREDVRTLRQMLGARRVRDDGKGSA